MDRLLPGRSAPTKATIGGVRYRLRSADVIAHSMLYDGVYERDVLEVLDRFMEEAGSGVLWDIGAHIGTVAFPLIKKHPGWAAVCFEPSPAVACDLLTNRRLNPSLADRIEVLIAPLAQESWLQEFFPSAEVENAGVGSLSSAHNTEELPVFVGGFSGDELVAEAGLPKPNLVKVDAEGFEYEVLAGMEQILESRAVRAVIFELTRYRYEARNRDGTAVLDLLDSHGYSIHKIHEDGRLAPVGEGQDAGWGDFLALPSNRDTSRLSA